MMKKTVLFAVSILMVFAMFNEVRAADKTPVAPPASAPVSAAAVKVSEAEAAVAAKKLDDLDAFGKNFCKMVLGKSSEVFQSMNFEFIIRLSAPPEKLKSSGKSVKELADKTREISKEKADEAKLKGVKCEILSKDVVPCDKMYTMLALSPNVQEVWQDNDKINDTERAARVAKAAAESGITSCGVISLKSQVKDNPEVNETFTTGMVGDKWSILEIISSEEEQNSSQGKK